MNMEFCPTMDNDSGYISHNQESTLDSSFCENSCGPKVPPSHNFYLSEDTLLEKPPTIQVFPNSIDSLINNSQESVKTEFSGFEDSDRSSASLIIPEAKPIVLENSGWNTPNNSSMTDDEEASLNHSICEHLAKTHNTGSRALKVLANLTNKELNHQSVMRKQASNKENIDPLAATPKKYENRLTSDVSPDLFAEEEELSRMALRQKSPPKRRLPKDATIDKDVKLLKRLQQCLTGVHPPPSVTMVQMTVTEMLTKLQDNKHLFIAPMAERSVQMDACTLTRWPNCLKLRHHGLHYNRNKISEEFEHLCSRFVERYVGAETQSTCTVFESDPPSSSKRKLSKPKWMAKSPGRRLSHLARRRITFNSSSLPGTSSAILGSRARQILVDAKKLSLLQRKSPRKTPSKSPFKVKKNTPSSSAKKKLAMRFREMSGEFQTEASTSSFSDRCSFKRALFASPNQDKSRVLMEKKSTKRTLFPSPQKSPFKAGKRKRTSADGDEDNPSKFSRNMSLDLRPASQSSESRSLLLLNRTLSDTVLRSSNRAEELSEQHKKKLQWAVYESLRMHNVTASHPQYKVFASVLARVTKKFLPSVKVEGRTTERMLRIARHHSYAVMKGKSVDEIMNEYLRNKLKNQKPHGYVGIEEFQKLRTGTVSGVEKKENVLQDKANIIESIEKRREHAGSKTKFSNENRIDRIKKVISFEEGAGKN